MTTPAQALAGVANVCQLLPTVVTGGQPTAAHLAAFKGAGGQVVLDLRDPMEPRPVEEAEHARALGLEYVAVPVTPGTMTDETLDRILGVLRQAGDRNVFVHCGSGNRVGGALLALLMLDHGFEQDDAVEQAIRIGLRNADLMEWGLDYVRRHRPGDAVGR
jgi:protein tyrosine phosphatase (PTP) superfamily phosphohydrolase (DUF442 family)